MGKFSCSVEQLIVSFSFVSDSLDAIASNEASQKICVELGHIDLSMLSAITYAPSESLHLLNEFQTLSGVI